MRGRTAQHSRASSKRRRPACRSGDNSGRDDRIAAPGCPGRAGLAARRVSGRGSHARRTRVALLVSARSVPRGAGLVRPRAVRQRDDARRTAGGDALPCRRGRIPPVRLRTADDRLRQALEIAGAIDDVPIQALVAQRLGSIAREQGRYDESEAHHRRSLDLWRERGDSDGISRARAALGFVAWLRGRPAEAEEPCAQALADFQRRGRDQEAAETLVHLGAAACTRASTRRLVSSSRRRSRSAGASIFRRASAGRCTTCDSRAAPPAAGRGGRRGAVPGARDPSPARRPVAMRQRS